MSLALTRRTRAGRYARAIPLPSYIEINASATGVFVAQGASTSFVVTLTRTNYTGTVTLAVSGLPTGVTGTWDSTTLTGGTTSRTLTLAAAGGATVTTSDAFLITASGLDISDDTITGDVTVIPAILGANPSPESTGYETIYIDTRAGGAHDIQAVSTYSAARTALAAGFASSEIQNIPFTGVNFGFDFTADFDGAGTSAFVSNLPGYGEFMQAYTNGGRGASTSAATPFTVDGLPAGQLLAAGTKMFVQRAGAGNWEAATVSADVTADGTGAASIILSAVNANSWGDNVAVMLCLANSDGYAAKGNYRELGNKFSGTLAGPAPTALWMSWKHWQGRTATGPGFDHTFRTSGPDRSSVVGEFVVQNEEMHNGAGQTSSGQNASRKYWLMSRDLGGSGGGRYDFIWPGNSTTGTIGTGTVDITYNPGTDTGTATFSTSQTLTVGGLISVGTDRQLYEIVSGSGTSWVIKSRLLKARLATSLTGQTFITTQKRTVYHQVNSNANGFIPLMPNTPGSTQQDLGTTAFRMDQAINQVIEYTCYVQASSTETALDGIVRVYANGELIDEHTALGYGDYGFTTLEIFGTVFNSPRQNQTEYFWDLVIWTPAPPPTVPTPSWEMNWGASFADTAALHTDLTANTTFQSDSINKLSTAIDTTELYRGTPSLRYILPGADSPNPMHTPQLVRNIPDTSHAWMQMPLKWMYGWSTVDAGYGYWQGWPITFDVTTDVDIATDSFTIPSHGLAAATTVSNAVRIGYQNGGGTATSIGGLTSGPTQVYYVIVVDANTIKLASSAANAFAGTAINLTSLGTVGTGRGHFFPTLQSGASYKLMGFGLGATTGTVTDTRTIFISTGGTGDLGALGNYQECQLEATPNPNGIFWSPAVTNIGYQFYDGNWHMFTYHFKYVDPNTIFIQGWIHVDGADPSTGTSVHIRWNFHTPFATPLKARTILFNRNFNTYRINDRYLNIGHTKFWDGEVYPAPLVAEGYNDGDHTVLPYFTTDTTTPNVTLARGTSTTFTIDITKVNGWASSFGTDVNADPSSPPNLPSGVTATFSPAFPTSGQNSTTVTLTAAADATTGVTSGSYYVYGSYNVGGAKHACTDYVTVTLTVT